MVSVKELRAWLDTLPEDSSVGVDDGGLTLIEVNAEGDETAAYYEVGGLPGSIFGDE